VLAGCQGGHRWIGITLAYPKAYAVLAYRDDKVLAALSTQCIQKCGIFDQQNLSITTWASVKKDFTQKGHVDASVCEILVCELWARVIQNFTYLDFADVWVYIEREY